MVEKTMVVGMDVSQFWRDMLRLIKPRIILLLVITCAAGFGLATKGNAALFDIGALIWTCVGLALSASGANMVNMWFDRDIDGLMRRTEKRPLPNGRLSPAFVLGLGVFLGGISTVLLAALVNMNTALLCLGGFLFYTLIYTMLLKRHTVQNIVIGGAAGAFPPLVGWAAVQGHVAEPLPWVLFGIIFLWTPPHFWALALLTHKDYARAKVPMLPVVKGHLETKRQMLWYALLLFALTLYTATLAPFGWLSLTGMVGLAVWWGIPLFQILKLGGEAELALARVVFVRSLFYLAWVFLILLADCFL